MGDVYVAEDLRLGRSVALKFLPSHGSETASSRERFLREAQAASRLDHPNICPVYEIDETVDGRMYIAMAHCEGETLKAVLERGRPTAERALEIGLQVAEALAEAHRNHVVHRDVKPANLMVVRGGRVKVLDFGLAKLQGQGDLTGPGVAVGTVAYMSPEQTVGDPVDARTDVWSLGVVLHEMLAGQRPFQGGHSQAVSWAIVHGDPPPLSGVSPALARLVSRALSKSPSRRHATMEELAAELRQVAGETGDTTALHPVLLVPPSAPPALTVGRADELAGLQAAFEEATSGRVRVVVVAGEAGLGKTTLVERFLSDLVRSGRAHVLLRGSCSERLAGTGAYLPLLEALRDVLRRSTTGVARELRALAPSWYVEVAADDTLPAPLEESARAASPERRKLELGAFLGSLSRSRPLVVFIDDLHWADDSTVDLLAHFATRPDAAGLLFVVAVRPAELRLRRHPFLSIEADLQARGLCREAALGFLSEADIGAYLESAFPAHRFPASFAEFLRAKTEGSPLFMVGIVDDLRSRGVVARDGAHWVLAQPLPAIERDLPQSVRGMIERKIGQLSEPERLLIEAGAVQGFELDSAVLARALEQDEERVEDGLQALQRVHAFLDFLGEGELPSRLPTARYRFVHALYHDVLYDSLPPARRRRLARTIAGALLELHAARLAPVASTVAVLLETARDFGPAADHYLSAARRSAAAHASREAALLCAKGIECAESLSEGPEREERLRALSALRDESLGDACEMAGRRAEARELYDSARRHLSERDPVGRARLCRKNGRTWQLEANYEEALKAHARAEAALQQGEEDSAERWREWIQIQLDRMELHYFARHLPELDELVSSARGVIDAHGTPAQRAKFFVSLNLAGMRRERYRPSEATLGHARAGFTASRDSGDLREEAWARFGLAFCHLWRGELEPAEEHLLGSLETCERVGDETTRTRCLTYLTCLYRMRGDVARCRDHAARSLESARTTGMKEYVATARANEAWIAWREGDAASARAKAREAVGIWRQLPAGHASAGFAWGAPPPDGGGTRGGRPRRGGRVRERAPGTVYGAAAGPDRGCCPGRRGLGSRRPGRRARAPGPRRCGGTAEPAALREASARGSSSGVTPRRLPDLPGRITARGSSARRSRAARTGPASAALRPGAGRRSRGPPRAACRQRSRRAAAGRTPFREARSSPAASAPPPARVRRRAARRRRRSPPRPRRAGRRPPARPLRSRPRAAVRRPGTRSPPCAAAGGAGRSTWRP